MQRILITGPESSGKSTLTRRLAVDYACPWVSEFARTFLRALDRPYQEADLVPLLLGQMDAEENAARRWPHSSYLFCDTGPEVLYIWSKWKYSRVALPIVRALRTRAYDRRLLCYPDLPWEADDLREAPDVAERVRLFQAYRALFQHYQLPYEVIRGPRAEFQL